MEDKDLKSIYQRLQRSNTTFRTTPFENIDKKLRALEIIKNKKVNVRAFLKSCHYKDSDTQLNAYNSQCCDWQEMESKELTREEYDLLVEVLK